MTQTPTTTDAMSQLKVPMEDDERREKWETGNRHKHKKKGGKGWGRKMAMATTHSSSFLVVFVNSRETERQRTTAHHVITSFQSS
jgi:hypothetical protein